MTAELGRVERERLTLFMVDRGQRAGLTWAQLADQLGFRSGNELKNHVKRLARYHERRLRREEVAG